MKIFPILSLSVFALIVACSPATLATQVLNNASIDSHLPVPVTSARPFGDCGGPVIQSINPAFERAVVEQTNQIRMQHGLAPLKRIQQLDESARFHSADMSVNDYFDHNTLARDHQQIVQVCDIWNRIETYYPNWQALAENIAAGQRTPGLAMDGWMNSPEHRANILSPDYSEIGVGFFEGRGEYRYYWDQDFGARDGVFPLVIDGEKAQTSQTHALPIYIYGAFDKIRLRNDDGAWGSWQPFQNRMTWDLPAAPGEHRVSAEMLGKAGRFTSSDTIQVVP